MAIEEGFSKICVLKDQISPFVQAFTSTDLYVNDAVRKVMMQDNGKCRFPQFHQVCRIARGTAPAGEVDGVYICKSVEPEGIILFA